MTHGVTGLQEMRLSLAVERIVLLLHSSNMFAQLDVSVTVGPVAATVATAPGASLLWDTNSEAATCAEVSWAAATTLCD